MQNKINEIIKEITQQAWTTAVVNTNNPDQVIIYVNETQQFVELFCEMLDSQYNGTLEYTLVATPGVFALPCDLDRLKISFVDDILEGTRKILFTTTAVPLIAVTTEPMEAEDGFMLSYKLTKKMEKEVKPKNPGYTATMTFEVKKENGYDKLSSILDFMVRERYPEVTKFADVLYFGPKIQLIEIMACLKYILEEEFGWESATDFCFTDPNAEHELHDHTNLIFTVTPEFLAFEIQGEDTNSGNLFWDTDNGLSFLDMCRTKQTELINWTKAN